MKLTIIGCSGSVPGPDSAASSYLIEADGAHVLLDLGSGALGPLQRQIGTAGLTDLDAVLLSHLHPDHCMDLCGLYIALRYGLRSSRRIPVYGPKGTAKRMAAAFGMNQTPGMGGHLDFISYPDAPFQVGPLTIRVVRVAHPGPAYAIRVEHRGRSLVYSGDTGPAPALVDLARGADVLLCEAAFDDRDDDGGTNTSANPPDLHLTGHDAGEHAAAAGAGRLIITHVPPWGHPGRAAEAAGRVFGGPVELAVSGAIWEV